LEVPVNGSLDDPEFNLGKMVYHAIKAALTRIVSSPFSALAALFGGKGEELSFQEFQPGSANLLPAAIAKLDVLAKALYAHPELQLEVEGSADGQTDLEALRRAKLYKQLLVQKGNAPANLFPAGISAAAMESQPAQNSRKAFAFEKGASALSRQAPDRSTFPIKSTLSENPPARSPLAGDKGATALMRILVPAGAAGDPDWERELLERVDIAPDALSTLAGERARNVRAYLIQTGNVEPQRITDSAQGASSKGSRVYLRLQ
jgi:outer membrane protein OmpA-like peptidoglycan-associated protein